MDESPRCFNLQFARKIHWASVIEMDKRCQSTETNFMFPGTFIRSALQTKMKIPSAFKRIWTDSRSIRTGDLFVAIPGEKFDGHEFVEKAFQQGAKGAIVSAPEFPGKSRLPKAFTLIQVKDTTMALRKLAKAYRSRLRIPIIAIAGSNGKTTTKEWLAYLLGQIHSDAHVFKTQKSQNSILGIALSLLQIRKEKWAVIEIGIDEPGWMDQHVEVVQPTHGLITTIAEEHLNRLSSIETIAKEELKLLKYLLRAQGGFAANQDCEWIRKHKLPTTSLTYALDERAQIEASFESPNVFNAFGLKWKSPLPGKHNAQNLLSALTMIRLLHPKFERSDFEHLSHSTLRFQGEAHRSQLISIAGDIQILDDCYNANPDSMEKALRAFLEISSGCRQHIVLGDMLDLGDSSALAHQRILNLVAVLGFDQIYLYGPLFAAAAKQLGQSEAPVKTFSDLSLLTKDLRKNLKPTDRILVKGSRGMAMEKVIENLQRLSESPAQ